MLKLCIIAYVYVSFAIVFVVVVLFFLLLLHSRPVLPLCLPFFHFASLFHSLHGLSLRHRNFFAIFFFYSRPHIFYGLLLSHLAINRMNVRKIWVDRNRTREKKPIDNKKVNKVIKKLNAELAKMFVLLEYICTESDYYSSYIAGEKKRVSDL